MLFFCSFLCTPVFGGFVSRGSNAQVPQGNMEWDMPLHNKGLSVALLSNDTPLTDDFVGNITAEGFALPAGFEDLAAVGGNDGAAVSGRKKKSVK